MPCNVDVCGIVTEVSEVRSWKKDDKAYTKYSFVVVDESEHSIDISIFADNIEKYTPEMMKGNPVVAIKGRRHCLEKEERRLEKSFGFTRITRIKFISNGCHIRKFGISNSKITSYKAPINFSYKSFP